MLVGTSSPTAAGLVVSAGDSAGLLLAGHLRREEQRSWPGRPRRRRGRGRGDAAVVLTWSRSPTNGGRLSVTSHCCAQLALVAVGADVADGHPLLVGRQMDDQRPDGERLEATGVPRRGVAAGEAGRVQVDGAVDRDAAPVGHLGARAEPGRGEALHHARDHVVGRARVVEVLLDQEGQEGDLAGERAGQQVVGVQVADRVEDLPTARRGTATPDPSSSGVWRSRRIRNRRRRCTGLTACMAALSGRCT